MRRHRHQLRWPSTLYALASSFVALRVAVCDNSGGGIVIERGAPVISNSEVSGNAFVGLSLVDVQAARIDHTLVAGNVLGISLSSGTVALEHVALAGNDGGALAVHGGSASLDHVSVIGTVGDDGAVVADADTTLSIHRSIVSGTVGGAGLVASGADVTVAASLLWDNDGGDYLGLEDQTGTNGNLSADPSLLDISAANPLDWDLHLASTSPAVDAGDDLDPDGSAGALGLYGGGRRRDVGPGWGRILGLVAARPL